MPVTQHPLHRSVRAELPHTAPALGCDDQTLAGVRVADTGSRKPMRNDSMHSSPAQVMGLSAPAQSAVPQSPTWKRNTLSRAPLQGTPKYRPCPATTALRPLCQYDMLHLAPRNQ